MHVASEQKGKVLREYKEQIKTCTAQAADEYIKNALETQEQRISKSPFFCCMCVLFSKQSGLQVFFNNACAHVSM